MTITKIIIKIIINLIDEKKFSDFVSELFELLLFSFAMIITIGLALYDVDLVLKSKLLLYFI